MTARPGIVTMHLITSRCRGFTLMEVLVSLIVAALFIMAVLGSQKLSFQYASILKDTNSALNTSQDFLARRYPTALQEPTPHPMGIETVPDARWELTKIETPDNSAILYDLRIEQDKANVSFSWLRVR